METMPGQLLTAPGSFSFPLCNPLHFPHTYGHQAACPNSVHSACKLQTLGHDSKPGCVVCTWEVGSKKEVSGDLEEWAWSHLAGSPQGCCGPEKTWTSSSHILLSYGEHYSCLGKARLRLFLLMVRNKIALVEGVGSGKTNEQTAIHHLNVNGLCLEFLFFLQSLGSLVESLPAVLGCLCSSSPVPCPGICTLLNSPLF